MSARFLLLLVAAAQVPRIIAAQGVTTAAIQGIVSAEDGSPIAGARIELTHSASGRRWEFRTRTDGRVLLEALAVGSYRVHARALGFVSETRPDLVLALGQRVVVDFILRRAPVELSPVLVTAEPGGSPDRGRTGPASIVSRGAIVDLPNPGRDFFALTLLSPQVVLSPRTQAIPTAGISIAGQNRLYNSFQIDGGMHHDAYRGQLPGRETLPRPLSPEALEELQVLAAPFDVRHGAFAGGVVNAVTRSGGNAVHGSLFAHVADEAFAQRTAGQGLGDFTTWEVGGSVGGPIVRDRAHYFVSVDAQRQVVPDPGPLLSAATAGDDTSDVGISYASAERFRTILDTLYGIDAGSLGPVHGSVRALDLFTKISLQLATSSQFEGTWHHARGNRGDFLVRRRRYYGLSSLGVQDPSGTDALRLIWTTLVGGRWSNELLVSHVRLLDECRPGADFPEIRVRVGPVAFLHAGTGVSCPPTVLRQDVLSVTDNATVGVGPHVLSIGAQAELLRFRDDLVQGSAGLWNFNSLDSLETGVARRYERTLAGPSGGGIDFRVAHAALYAQDRWTPVNGLTVTVGVRLDAAILPDAGVTNPSVLGELGIDTGRRPGSHVLLSPRLAVNYDAGGDGRTVLRGGVGLFSGRYPYRWLANAYAGDGIRQTVVDCRGAQAPAFEPLSQPADCASTGPRPRINVFDPGMRPPHVFKAAIGADRLLPGRLVGTLDMMYTHWVRQPYVIDANLSQPVGVSHGEGGRLLHGSISTAGVATPARSSAAADHVVWTTNRAGDGALSIAAQLATRFGGAMEASAMYAFTRSRDRMTIVHLGTRAVLEGTVLDGPLDDRRLATSLIEIPHRVQLQATMRLPYQMRLTVLYDGASGRPFTYTVAGDANADGLGENLRQDAVYVPRDSLDIALVDPGEWAELDRYIDSRPCLRAQRGRLLARNSCRNPWFGTFTARVTRAFRFGDARSLEVWLDSYNVLNLIHPRWGLSHHDAVTFATDLLVLRGYDASAGRGIYKAVIPTREVDYRVSRGRAELGVRYVF